jgi:hypothetical protein
LIFSVSGGWKASRHLERVVWSQQGDWQLQFVNGQVEEAQLAANSWVTPWVWCLRFESAGIAVAPVLVWRSQLSTQAWQLWRTRIFLEGRRPATEPA